MRNRKNLVGVDRVARSPHDPQPRILLLNYTPKYRYIVAVGIIKSKSDLLLLPIDLKFVYSPGM